MNITQMTSLCREMILLYSYLSGPVIIAGMIIGLVVGILQTITQIQEQSIGFVLKMAATVGTLLFLAPWMLSKTIDFTAGILGNLDKFVR